MLAWKLTAIVAWDLARNQPESSSEVCGEYKWTEAVGSIDPCSGLQRWGKAGDGGWVQAGGSMLQRCFNAALLTTSGPIHHRCCLSSCPFCPLPFFGPFFEVFSCDKNVSGPAGNLSKSKPKCQQSWKSEMSLGKR